MVKKRFPILMSYSPSKLMANTYLKSYALTLSLMAGGLSTNAFANESDPVVARVDGTPIRLSYVYQHIESLPLGDQIDVRDQLDRFTESVIQEQLLFQYALNQLDEDLEFREQIKTLVLSNLIERHVKSRIDITEKQVEAYYRDNRNKMSSEHWRVHQIPLHLGTQCEALMPQITSLESFTELARKYSKDPGLASQGGDMGYVMRQQNVLGLGEALFALPLNKVHRVDSENACHLIWISEYLKSPIPKLDEIRDRIYQALVNQQEVSLLNSLLESASRNVMVERYIPTENANPKFQ